MARTISLGSNSSLTSRSVDLSFLHPTVRAAVEAVLGDLSKAAIPLFVFEAFRSPERQAFLFAQGRTRPGNKVTFADAWRSYHQYGLAVDLVFGGPGKWSWDEPRKGMWKKMHEIGRKHGLMPLDFETPHLQLAGTTSAALLSGAYPAGGDANWAENLNAAIRGWKGEPKPPPVSTTRPGRGMSLAASRAAPVSDRVHLLALDGREARDQPGPDKIMRIAAGSSIAKYQWSDRGRAPIGYIEGMALVYAQAHARLKIGNDPFVKAMAKADSGNDQKDALSWYRSQLAANGMSNDDGGPNTLRNLFVLLVGLGMRESSGRYCEGRDRSASNTTGATAEAGLFQVSYNASTASPLLPKLFGLYKADPQGFKEVFSSGVTCKPRDWENFGSGDGQKFQELTKTCPAFAVQFAAIGLRVMRNHWGPINRHEAEVPKACNAMLLEVQAAVEAAPTIYAEMK